MPETPARAVALPPRVDTAGGHARRIGIEIEFSGLDVAHAARLAAEVLGGEVHAVSDYEHRVTGAEFGDWVIELDFEYLKKLGRAEAEAATDAPAADPAASPAAFDFDAFSEDVLAAIAKRLVPVEIVTPPVPITELARLRPLTERLRAAGALGTTRSPLYAFGLHMNPELPDLEAATIAGYLKAFLCLHEWLIRSGGIDWSRRLTPYIAAFPGAYVARVIDPAYRPDLDTLTGDYLAANPVRNRALDLLPLLAHLDEARVRAAVDDPRVKPRPTLHYRLPNCDIDRPGWTVEVPWAEWLEVERLACDAARLERTCAAYARHLASPLGGLVTDWAEECERLLRAG